MLKDFIDAQGWEMREYEWPDRYFFGKGVGERRLVVAEDADENEMADTGPGHKFADVKLTRSLAARRTMRRASRPPNVTGMPS